MPALIAAELAAMVRKHQLQSVYIGTDSPKSVEEVKQIWNTLDVRCGQCRQWGVYARYVVLLLIPIFTAAMPTAPLPYQPHSHCKHPGGSHGRPCCLYARGSVYWQLRQQLYRDCSASPARPGSALRLLVPRVSARCAFRAVTPRLPQSVAHFVFIP